MQHRYRSTLEVLEAVDKAKNADEAAGILFLNRDNVGLEEAIRYGMNPHFMVNSWNMPQYKTWENSHGMPLHRLLKRYWTIFQRKMSYQEQLDQKLQLLEAATEEDAKVLQMVMSHQLYIDLPTETINKIWANLLPTQIKPEHPTPEEFNPVLDEVGDGYFKMPVPKGVPVIVTVTENGRIHIMDEDGRFLFFHEDNNPFEVLRSVSGGVYFGTIDTMSKNSIPLKGTATTVRMMEKARRGRISKEDSGRIILNVTDFNGISFYKQGGYNGYNGMTFTQRHLWFDDKFDLSDNDNVRHENYVPVDPKTTVDEIRKEHKSDDFAGAFLFTDVNRWSLGKTPDRIWIPT